MRPRKGDSLPTRQEAKTRSWQNKKDIIMGLLITKTHHEMSILNPSKFVMSSKPVEPGHPGLTAILCMIVPRTNSLCYPPCSTFPLKTRRNICLKVWRVTNIKEERGQRDTYQWGGWGAACKHHRALSVTSVRNTITSLTPSQCKEQKAKSISMPSTSTDHNGSEVMSLGPIRMKLPISTRIGINPHTPSCWIEDWS